MLAGEVGNGLVVAPVVEGTYAVNETTHDTFVTKGLLGRPETDPILITELLDP